MFRYEVTDGSVTAPEQFIRFGMEGASVTGLQQMRDGNGLRSDTQYRMTGMQYVVRIVLLDGQLNWIENWTGAPDDTPPAALDGTDIVWRARSDTDFLRGLSDALPTDGDRIVLSGTFRNYSYDEVVRLQGAPDPNAASADRSMVWQIITLDAPTLLRGRQDVSEVEKEVSMIVVGNSFINTYVAPPQFDPEALDGQHVVFSIGSLSWPSGTDLPLGVPSCYDVHILD